MPAVFEDLTEGYLFAAYHPMLEGTEGEEIPYQFDTWIVTAGALRQRMRNQYLYNRENPGPPATFELWHFALRHYLNLGFESGTFWMPRRPRYTDSTWWKEVGRGEIFIDPNWAMVQKYIPGINSWDHESNPGGSRGPHVLPTRVRVQQRNLLGGWLIGKISRIFH